MPIGSITMPRLINACIILSPEGYGLAEPVVLAWHWCGHCFRRPVDQQSRPGRPVARTDH